MYKRPISQRGLTLIETLISVSMVLILVGIVTTTLQQASNNNRYLRMQGQMKDRMQMTLYNVNRELSQAKRLFDYNSLGLNFLYRVPLSATPINERARVILPTIRSSGSFVRTQTCDVYPDAYHWPLAYGNSLFFAKLNRSFNQFSFSGSPTSTDFRTIDLYQFVLYYVKPEPTKPLFDVWNSSPSMPAQSLVKWESRIYADYNQYRAYMLHLDANGKTTYMSAVRSQLSALGVVALWNPLATPADDPYRPFYNLQAAVAPTHKDTNQRSTVSSAGMYQIETLAFKKAVLLEDSDTPYSIAYNKQSNSAASDFFPLNQPVPTFYNATPTPSAGACGVNAIPSSPRSYGGPANSFPGGFEVGIIGPNSGRSVYLNLTMVGRINNQRMVEQNHTLSAYARDL